MPTSSRAALLLFTAACLTACSPATPDTAPTPPVAAAVVPPPPRAATPCPVASADNAGVVTNKARHVPNEDDPCADSRGVARH